MWVCPLCTELLASRIEEEGALEKKDLDSEIGEGSKFIAITSLDVTVIDCFAQGAVFQQIADGTEATEATEALSKRTSP
ncbi:unnamed protein product [Echinostoma caproni]|uniref:Uncharacterized protein n=1 Tax=Echinostoma caproni TaxID=27848 RepID=A0A183B7E3_9TREM|nr:unnamed protein product [Echinostoma caproni]